MKKILPVLWVLLMLLSLAACRKEPPDNPGTAPSETTTDTDAVPTEITPAQTTAPSGTTQPETMPETAPAHIHAYGAWHTVTAATCTNGGLEQRQCACGEKDSRSTPATGHTEVLDTPKPATCTETGLTDGKHCSVCGTVLVPQQGIPATGHKYTDDACERCGAKETPGFAFTLNDDNQSYTVKNGNCTDSNLVIPSTYNGKPVTAISTCAFEKCAWITSVTIPDSVTHIGKYAFDGCKKLESVTFGKNVKVIEEFAFYGCLELSAVTIPDGTIAIDKYAFANCRFLDRITLPDSVLRIGYGAFSDTVYLKSENNRVDGAVYIDNHLVAANVSGDFIVRPGTRTIADQAFTYNRGLTSIAIPDSIAKIGENAFEFCTNLTSIYYGGTKAQWEAMSEATPNGTAKECTVHCTDGDILKK